MQYTYEVTHKMGSANGTITADSEEEARQKVRKLYQGEFVDDEGKTEQNSVLELNLYEVSEP